jgi:hypothetical protein
MTAPKKRNKRPAQSATRRHWRLPVGLGLVLLVAGAAAAGWFAWQRREAPAVYTPRPAGSITFNKDIAPIMFEQCSSCHRPGESAPFLLLNYADVKKRITQIADVTHRQFMPPWMPEAGHEPLQQERRLSVEQMGLIEQWIAEGSPEGTPEDLPKPPEWTEGWQRGKPDLIVTMPEAYTLSSDGKDVYRNFVIPVPTTALRHVKAIEFRPSSKAVHHAFFRFDRTQDSRRQDAQEPGPGFEGMTAPPSAYSPPGHFMSWQPGRGPVAAPEGLAWPLPGGMDMVLLMHLQPRGKPEEIQASVGFYFTDQPATNTPAKMGLKVYDIDIPAGATNYAVEKTLKLPVDVDVLATLPHAHYLGRRLEGFARLPDGTHKTLLLIPDWNFNWQSDYRFATPVFLPKGTELGMRFSYDNSTNNVRNPNHPPTRVKYGLQTTNEMGELHFQMLARHDADRPRLAREEQLWARQDIVKVNEQRLRDDPTDSVAMVEIAKIHFTENDLKGAEVMLRRALALRPDVADTHYTLGVCLMDAGNPAAAEAAFVTAIRLGPGNFMAYSNAGTCAMRLGRLDAAVMYFDEALRLNPNDTLAKANLDLVLKAQNRARRRM